MTAGTQGARRANGAPAWLDDATIARYTHYERLPLHAMVGLEPELALVLDAHFVGCTPERLREIREEQAQATARAVADLLEDERVVRDLARLPAVTGERVVVLGDSITADSLSWANLLGPCLAQCAPGAGVTVRNLAVSGSTTSETIPMFDLVVRERPTCVLAMLGTNDGRRQGRSADVRTVSASETRRNVLALQGLTEAEAGARFVAIAPPPMDQRRYDAATPEDSPTRFSSADLAETVEVLRGALPEVIDVTRALEGSVDDAFWLPDGLHPTLAGQRDILRQVVHGLAALPPAGAR